MRTRTLAAALFLTVITFVRVSASTGYSDPQPLPATYLGLSPSLRELVQREAPAGPQSDLHRVDLVEESESSAMGSHLPAPLGPAASAAIPPTQLSFDAISSTTSAYPSASADVGPAHYVLICNILMQVYDKSGTALTPAPFNYGVLWKNQCSPCELQPLGSPTVLYDQFADRWVIAQAASYAIPYQLCIAVSQTGDPLGAYHRWSFDVGNRLPDYTRLALWGDAYYISSSEFTNGTTFAGTRATAIHRGDLLAGVPGARSVSFLAPGAQPSYTAGLTLWPADIDGSMLPPSGSPAYFLGSMDNGGGYGAPQDAITLWRFHADFATPANSSFTLAATLPVNAFDSIFPCSGTRRCIPQPGATASQYLDVGSSYQRLLPRIAYRNFGTHESIVANQSVEAVIAIAGVRWYELRDPGGTPFVYQQGTYAPGATDGVHRWNAGLAMDAVGNLGVGYSVSNASIFPGVRYSGRLAADLLGTLPQGEGVIVNGVGIQTNTINHWGHYSSMNVDPSDDCTFWYVNQYYPANSTFVWRLRVGTFRFPNCVSTTSTQPTGGGPGPSRLAPIGAVRGPVSIRFTLSGTEARPVTLELIDVAGRRIRTILASALAGGEHQVQWDGASTAGDRVRPGVYHLRLRSGEERDSQPVMLLD